jgi:hypothetical protein
MAFFKPSRTTLHMTQPKKYENFNLFILSRLILNPKNKPFFWLIGGGGWFRGSQKLYFCTYSKNKEEKGKKKGGASMGPPPWRGLMKGPIM